MRKRHDIVVVGCGIAGLSAAVTAARHGADVALLERSPKEVRGGNSRYTEAYLRLENETKIADDFVDKLAENPGGYIHPELLSSTIKPYDEWPPMLKAYSYTDPELIMTFADGVPDSIAWLKSFGIRFESEATAFLTKSAPRMTPVGGGEILVETLAAAAEKEGITFYYNTTARSLKTNEKSEVNGLYAWSSLKGPMEFTSKAVILASGGFEGNSEMLTKYFGIEGYLMRTIALGGNYNKGEGIQMALDIGAAPAGQYGGAHAEPCDPRSTRAEPTILVFPYGIIVNQNGERFVDESWDVVDMIYDRLARTIWKQPKGMCYCICDAKIEDVPNYKKSIRTEKPPIIAKSIDELADKLGIKQSTLKNTIQRYNDAIQPGEFKPLVLDGKHTEGIVPPKSNWARPIDKPVFIAYPMIGAVVFTFGGLKVTPRAEVLNRDGFVIPGLYAAGETVGLFYHFYPGATSVLRGCVFGRLAGDNAAKIMQYPK